MFHTVAGRGF